MVGNHPTEFDTSLIGQPYKVEFIDSTGAITEVDVTDQGNGHYVVTTAQLVTESLTAGIYAQRVTLGGVVQSIDIEPINWDGATVVRTVTTDAASRTASQATGFATMDNVTDATTAIINEGNASWMTGGIGTISPIEVSKKRTFFAGREGSRSSNIVTIQQAASGIVTLAAEPELNDDADINPAGAHTVTVVGPTGLLVGNISVRSDGQALHFDIPADLSPGDYVVTIGVQTLDGQTIAMTGKLVVK